MADGQPAVPDEDLREKDTEETKVELARSREGENKSNSDVAMSLGDLDAARADEAENKVGGDVGNADDKRSPENNEVVDDGLEKEVSVTLIPETGKDVDSTVDKRSPENSRVLGDGSEAVKVAPSLERRDDVDTVVDKSLQDKSQVLQDGSRQESLPAESIHSDQDVEAKNEDPLQKATTTANNEPECNDLKESGASTEQKNEEVVAEIDPNKVEDATAKDGNESDSPSTVLTNDPEKVEKTANSSETVQPHQTDNLDPIAQVEEPTNPNLQQASEEITDLEQYVEAENPQGNQVIEMKKSIVETAVPGDALLGEGKASLPQPLSLCWCFGFNPSLPVHNISQGDTKMMFYVSSHTGVLYDCTKHKQHLLQGHGNPITCTAVSGDRRWLVTADVGKDPILTVWDSFSGLPIRTVYKNLGQGTIAVAMSHDARYVASASVGMPQVVCVWDWTCEKDEPLCSISLNPDLGLQACLVFNKEDPSLLVSNSDDQVVFYAWKKEKIRLHSKEVSDKDFNRSVGLLSQSCFLPGSPNHCVTGTAEGCCVVWEAVGMHEGVPVIRPEIRQPVKLMKMHDSPITVVTSINKCIVTGDAAGHVKFFTSELLLLQWYDSCRYGPVSSISAAYTPKLSSVLPSGYETKSSYPSQYTLTADLFVIPDFFVSNTTANIVHVTTNGTIIDVISREHDAAIHALVAHPNQPRLLIGSYSSQLKLWDYEKRQVVVSRHLGEQSYIQCVNFDPKGDYVGVGMTSGHVHVLDGLALLDCCPSFHFSKDCVTHISFSHDSHYMATADADRCVIVYVNSGGREGSQEWQFLAKYRSHYKEIQAILFGVFVETGQAQLLSLGADRMLVEYDLAASREDDLHLLSKQRIEQSAVPTAATWYPPLTKESFLLTANDQYKLKLYNTSTKMCRMTLLGPTFGTPITRMCVLPAPILYTSSGEEKRRYLAYITKDKVGLLLLPHNGNPHNTSCLIAHSGLVTELGTSHDGQFLFTAGGEDCTVHMWRVNVSALEVCAQLGGQGLEPFYSLIEGGREGEFFTELEEYFYYALLKSQGPNAMTSRHVSDAVPIEQIPCIMRAIGFYPSELEIENILNEVKFSCYVSTGKPVTHINLDDFIRLYINHRPVFGLAPAQFLRAFRHLGKREADKEWSISRPKFLSMLQERGEHMTETELVECLMTVLGHCDNPEELGSFSRDPVAILQEKLPLHITASKFAEELLGFTT